MDFETGSPVIIYCSSRNLPKYGLMGPLPPQKVVAPSVFRVLEDRDLGPWEGILYLVPRCWHTSNTSTGSLFLNTGLQRRSSILLLEIIT